MTFANFLAQKFNYSNKNNQIKIREDEITHNMRYNLHNSWASGKRKSHSVTEDPNEFIETLIEILRIPIKNNPRICPYCQSKL